MKINFIVNTTGLTGGIRVVFVYANKLAEKGHDVKIIYPYNLPGKWFSKNGITASMKWIKFSFLKLAGKNGADWFPLKAKILRVPTFNKKWIPDADVIIATANETADWVSKLPIEKGEKFYFIQDYEIWTRSQKEVNNTYKLPLKKIVISSWLKNLMEDRFKEKVYGLITNGVDFDIFYNKTKKFNKKKRILMLYHILEKKGIKDGLKAFKIVQKKHPEIKLVMYSAYPKGKDVPENVEFYTKPSSKKLRNLYSNSDIFISPSWQEGCQLPPMEAMACKTAVVATSVGGVPDYTIPNKTAMVVPPKKPELLAKAILELIQNKKKLKQISESGYKFIKQFSWDKASEKFEKLLKKAGRYELKKEPKVAVIVLNWNQKKMTSRCISKLLDSNYKNFKIFVIDNASQDGSQKYLKEKFKQEIELMLNSQNLGYAQGNNKGIKQAIKEKFEYILVINNDVEVDKNALKEMIKTSENNPQIGMVIPKVYYPESKLLQSTGGKIVWKYGEARLRGHLEKDNGQYDKISEADFAPGVCVLIPKKIIDKIGLISTEYYMYGEDVDWSFVAKKYGYKIIYTPKAKILHYESLSAKHGSPNKTYYYIRNILIFMKKWASWPTWIYFIPCFSYKITKMSIKYLSEGKLGNIKAIIIAKWNFLRGEKGENKTFTFNYNRKL